MVDPVLTSGFLSALKSFTSQSRSSQINSYTSESEIVIFKRITNTSKDLVAIFETTTDEHYAETLINQIDKLLSKTKIMYEKNLIVTDSKEGRKISQKIDGMLKLSTSQKAQLELASNLFNSHKVELLSIYDVKRKKSLSKLYRNEARKALSKHLTELDTAVDLFVSQLHLGESYIFAIVESDDKRISFYKSGNKITLCQGSGKRDDYIKLPLNINGYLDIDDFIGEFLYLNEKNKWRMRADKSVNVIRGDPPYWRDEQACFDLIGEFDKFMLNVFEDQFFKIQIHTTKPELSQATILRQHTADSHEFTIYREDRSNY
jgi:hypothetical protein